MDSEGFWTLLLKDNVYLKVFDDVMERYPILRRLAEMTQNTATKLINLTEYSVSRQDIMDYIHNTANVNTPMGIYYQGAERVQALFGSKKDTAIQLRKRAIHVLNTYSHRVFTDIYDPIGLFQELTTTPDNNTVVIGSKNDQFVYGIRWAEKEEQIRMRQRFLQYCGCEQDPAVMEGIFIPYYNELTF
jgi:hypothetical protein